MEGEDGEETEADEDIPPAAKTGKPFPQVSVWRRVCVIAAGAVMNFLLGYLVLVLLLSMQDYLVSKQIATLEEGAASALSGLQVDDEILSINGRRCYVASDIFYELERAPGGRADFVVRRNGQTVQVPDVAFDWVEGQDGSQQLQLGFKVYAMNKSVGRVLRQAGEYTLYYARIVFRSLADLITGRVSVNELSGPVGIVSAIGQAAAMGLDEILSLMALITVNLGVFNMLPFPALDGGRLVFLLVEGITRRRVPRKFELWVNAAGMALLLGLMLFATYNDIARLFTTG